MKLIGNLKNQVENAKSKEEAKGIIEKAGMSLTMDELDMVTGGALFYCRRKSRITRLIIIVHNGSCDYINSQ